MNDEPKEYPCQCGGIMRPTGEYNPTVQPQFWYHCDKCNFTEATIYTSPLPSDTQPIKARTAAS